MRTRRIIKIVYILVIIAIILAPISNVQSATRKCNICNGTGKVYSNIENKLVKCTQCGGSGNITYTPSSSQGSINPDDYKPGDLTASDYLSTFAMAKKIYNAILIVGVVISVIACMYLGMKYMVGSVEQKAEYKKTIIPMIVGMIMLVVTGTFVSIIFNIVSSLNDL